MFSNKSDFWKSHSRTERAAYKVYENSMNKMLIFQKQRGDRLDEIIERFPHTHYNAFMLRGSIADLIYYARKEASTNKKWMAKGFMPEEYMAIFEKESILEILKQHPDIGDPMECVYAINALAASFVKEAWAEYNPKNIDEAGDIIKRITMPRGYLHRYFVMMEIQHKYDEVFGK